VGKGSPWQYSAYALSLNWGTCISFFINTPGQTNIAKCGLSTGQWYHFVGTYNKDGGTNNAKLYINGTEVNQKTVIGSLSVNDLTLVIGRGEQDYGKYCDGIIDEVRVSNATRSPEWVSAEFNNQSSPITFYSLGNQEPSEQENIPEFTIITAIIAAVAGFGIYFVIRQRKNREKSNKNLS
jgi:hypothetical protein